MRDGYSKKYRFLPIIDKKQAHTQQISEQKSILMQLQRIDEIIKSGNIKLFNGYIFTSEVKDRLTANVYSALKKTNSLISYGFEIRQQNQEEQVSYMRTNVANKKLSFQQKLKDLSMKKVCGYDQQRISKLTNMLSRKWTVSRKVSNSKQQPMDKRSSIRQISKASGENTSSKISKVSGGRRQKAYSKYNVYTQVSQNIPEKDITLEKIEDMINRNQKGLHSIWLPPITYPQFFGIFMLSINASSKIRCKLKKYLFCRNQISKRLFEAILRYASQKYSVEVEVLEIMVERTDFAKYFEPYGWIMKSSEGISKIMAVYNRNMQHY